LSSSGGTSSCESALVPDDIGTHTLLYHTEQQGLNDSVELVVLRGRVGSLDVGQDLFSDERTERRGSGHWKKREKRLQESVSRLFRMLC
jgi:hypothetical protein